MFLLIVKDVKENRQNAHGSAVRQAINRRSSALQ
jgi:hypothetical protein